MSKAKQPRAASPVRLSSPLFSNPCRLCSSHVCLVPFQNVCRSLLEKDKLLFAFLLCTRIMGGKGEVDQVGKSPDKPRKQGQTDDPRQTDPAQSSCLSIRFGGSNPIRVRRSFCCETRIYHTDHFLAFEANQPSHLRFVVTVGSIAASRAYSDTFYTLSGRVAVLPDWRDWAR